jgi:hypothetical protein
VASFVIALVALTSGGIWGLAQVLDDKQDKLETEKELRHHDEYGHRRQQTDIQSIRDEQVEQRTILKDQGHKLDRILERTQKR